MAGATVHMGSQADPSSLTSPTVHQPGRPGKLCTTAESRTVYSSTAAPQGSSQGGQAVSSPPSHKSILVQYTQKRRLPAPQYAAKLTTGGFRSTVTVYRPSGTRLSFTSDTQTVKRDSEEEAARLACYDMDLI